MPRSGRTPACDALPDRRLESACPAPTAGVDEAGRGPWAGPVCAGAVILAPGIEIEGLDDSKRLTAARRGALAPRIKVCALARKVMEGAALPAVDFSVPLLVEARAAANWDEAH